MSTEQNPSKEVSPKEQESLGWITTKGEKLAPAFKIVIMTLICAIAIGARVFSVIRYESVSLHGTRGIPFNASPPYHYRSSTNSTLGLTSEGLRYLKSRAGTVSSIG